ncbi:MAG: hypothetical protein ACP5U2_13815 [Bryobacteraceae bacterium]
MRDGLHSARVGYHGSFWVDRESLDLLRLDVEAEGLPETPLEVTVVRTAIRYARTGIQDTLFVLPVSSELTIGTGQGRSSQNRTSFSACRQYVAHSEVRFEEGEKSAGQSEAPRQRHRLPPDLNLEIALARPLEPATAAAGDPLEGILARDARRHGAVVAPKGARLLGRLRSVRQHLAPRSMGVIVLEFNRLEAPGMEAEFRARLELLGGIVAGARRQADVVPVSSAGESAIFFNGRLLRLPRGFRMLWRTLP